MITVAYHNCCEERGCYTQHRLIRVSVTHVWKIMYILATRLTTDSNNYTSTSAPIIGLYYIHCTNINISNVEVNCENVACLIEFDRLILTVVVGRTPNITSYRVRMIEFAPRLNVDGRRSRNCLSGPTSDSQGLGLRFTASGGTTKTPVRKSVAC